MCEYWKQKVSNEEPPIEQGACCHGAASHPEKYGTKMRGTSEAQPPQSTAGLSDWHARREYATCDIPANAKLLYNFCKMLDQRRRRWADVVQMLYKCFVFTGIVIYVARQITVGRKKVFNLNSTLGQRWIYITTMSHTWILMIYSLYLTR